MVVCRTDLDLDLRGVEREAAQSVFEVTIRESLAVFFECSASASSLFLGRNIHVHPNPSHPTSLSIPRDARQCLHKEVMVSGSAAKVSSAGNLIRLFVSFPRH